VAKRKKIDIWDKDKAKEILSKRLKEAKEARRPQQDRWRKNEAITFSQLDLVNTSSIAGAFQLDSGGFDINRSQGDQREYVAVNYLIRYLRFIHSQLAANPPSVVPKAMSYDTSDRERADAADRLIRMGQKKYDLNEVKSNAALYTLCHGTGFIKGIWNPDLGEILNVDKKSGEIEMEGDYEAYAPNIWNIYPDPVPATWSKVRYVFERFSMPLLDAIEKFGDEHEAVLRQSTITSEMQQDNHTGEGSIFAKDFQDGEEVVSIYQYWEAGNVANGMLGRFCWCTESGCVIGDVEENPHQFASISSDASLKNVPRKKLPKKARIPYHIWTDIDIPNTYWGLSVIDFTADLQESINAMDSTWMENVEAHGSPHILVPDSAELEDEALDNSPWTYIKFQGQQPYAMNPAQMPSFFPQLRTLFSQSIMEIFGLNENALGEQSRRQSGASMQYATQQSNAIRHRLFEKYTRLVEFIYKDYLDVLIENWEVPRIVAVIGKEKAFEAKEIDASDIAGGWDLTVEYGTSLPLDPIMRQEMLMQLQPVFEAAGVPPQKILSLLKLNDLGGAFELMDLGRDRQKEVFEEMRASGQYIKPQEHEHHQSMITYAEEYVMTAEFKALPKNVQTLITKHFKARKEMAAAQAAPPPQAAQGPQQGAEPPGSLGAMLGLDIGK